MERLTNALREAAMSAALRAAFTPRFTALQEVLEARAEAWLLGEHPEFVKAKKVKALRPYLRLGTTLPLHFVSVLESGRKISRTFRRPTYHPQFRNMCSEINREPYQRVEGAESYKVGTLDVPEGAVMEVPEGDSDAVAYEKLWTDYDAAREALHGVFYAYQDRDKLEEAFPELSKYLPPRAVKSRALSVPVDALRTRLKAAGV